MTLGTKIRKVRDLKGRKQEYIAAKVGIPQGVISEIENDKIDPHYSIVLKIADALEVEIGQLVGFDEQKMFFNITDNKDQSNNGYIVQTSKNEKELYDKIITQQQNEIGYLRKILDSYVR